MKRIIQTLAFSLAIGSAALAANERPNIIVLLTDDQSLNSLGCYGNPQVSTPHIDRLGEQGIIFDSHYDNTSICKAARATIMTGMQEYKTGCNFTRGPLIRKKWEQSYPVLLRKAGYYTGFAGKFGFPVTDDLKAGGGYHTNNEMPMGSFDVWFGWPGQGSYKTAENEFVAHYADKYPHSTRALGAASQDFIQQARKTGKPFCLSVSFKAPHGPTSPDKDYDSVYADTVWEIGENYDEVGAAHLPQQAKSGRQYLSILEFRPETFQKKMRAYQQTIYGVDVAVGMIREELERQGIVDNTVIIFTSDNGYNCGAHGFSGKVLPYEEGSGVPMIVYDPRHPNSNRGLRSQAVTGSIDIAPTVMDLAGLPDIENADGASLLPLIDNPHSRVRDAMALINVWGNVPTHSFAVVTDSAKYIYWFFEGEGMKAAEELYHLGKDRQEMNNLVKNPEYQSMLQEMREHYDQALLDWKNETVPDSGYPDYVTLFDQDIAWNDKAALIKPKQIENYRKAVASSKAPKQKKANKSK
ncbi:MAG: sulfatase [Opitutales bacterium]|jgi:arylsulfatase A-like enzyme|nr:sulfatase [Opitutales bacterium]